MVNFAAGIYDAMSRVAYDSYVATLHLSEFSVWHRKFRDSSLRMLI